MCIRCKNAVQVKFEVHEIFIIVLTTCESTEKPAISCMCIVSKKKTITSIYVSVFGLIDAPSLKEMHMHNINILLCFTFPMCEVARCVKDPRRWTFNIQKYHSDVSRFLLQLERARNVWMFCIDALNLSWQSRSTCDMDMNFPVPKKMRKTSFDVRVIFWGYVLLFSHSAGF